MTIRWFFVFVTMVCLAACQHNEPSVTVRYQDVGSLRKGDKVILNGVLAGEVLGFHIAQNIVLADLSIQEGVKLPVGSRFIIRQSLLGPASIVIEQSNSTEFIAHTDTIAGETFKEPVLDSVKQKKVQAAFGKMAEGFAELVQTLSKDSTVSGK